ncbi:MAG: HAD-IA family hydrolase [Actinomycetota bacterium]
MSATRPALVFDFGGPVLVTPFELTAATEARLGLAPGELGWAGPFAPGGDPEWAEVLAGQQSERGYWALRGEEFGRITGRTGDTRDLISVMYEGDQVALLRPGALALMRDARAAGLPVGVLTNDLRAFHSKEWVEGLGLGELVDVVVDGSVEGILKPDPRIYRMTASRLGVRCEDVVFLDDQPVNLAGAADVGMTAVPVDVTDPAKSFERARELTGL